MNEKRYLTLNQHLRETFGQKVMKISLDGGFDCPNRDGTVAFGGCTFCSSEGSGDYAGRRTDSIEKQFREIKTKMHNKWKEGKYIAYFQAYTNTHAPVEVLRDRFEPVLLEENVVGISIGTRPDCLPDNVVEYLADLNKRTYLWVELGLQTIHEETGNLINRAHDYETYVRGVEKLRKHGIQVCTHIINGLPGETREMMMETVQAVTKLDVQGVKLHLLHLLKGTPMIKQFEKGQLKFMSQAEYVNLVCDQLEILPPNMVIHRITGDGPIHLMIGPMWSMNKWEVLNAIDDEMRLRGSYQGRLYKKNY
ncbi:MAG: family radical protein [Bacillales bacterium]|jgi:radical SAM protein (TIGR01212 family)|nr:family radical protein [Bacillales bacterium]